MKHIFPLILIFLNLCASVTCVAESDIKMAVYWFAAAVLNICVTF